MTLATCQGPASPSSWKIQTRHLDRLAVVYVRQSSVQQVVHHQESTRRQYELQEVAVRMGWPAARVLTIDEDLGISGASAEGRAGFQRLLAEVALDHVGLILGIEMSRLARSCRDWYQLLELCSVFGTLIGDLDGVYDPAQYNDRLLLGLKGTMSEAELHVLRQRLIQGKIHKARRGELSLPLPSGYVRLPDGSVALDPDEEVQAAVRTLFDQFERLGSIHAALRHLVRLGVRFGWRRGNDPHAPLEWRRPSQGLLTHMIHNPTYAGAYAYGRSACDPRHRRPGHPTSGRHALPPTRWQACLRDAHPAYISWETYERNLAQLAQNQAHLDRRGAIREGRGLLQGLLVCGRCGARMRVNARGRRYATYVCAQAYREHAGPFCQSLSSHRLDEEVSRLALAALEPAALEVSLRVAQDIEQARAEAEAHWHRRRERARFEAERAARQYHAVEPENRLVARTLETAWNERLLAQRKLEEDYARFAQAQPRVLTEAEREAVRALATDLPALWNAPTTTDRDRKAVLRQVIEQVVITVRGDSEGVDAVVHWAGGRRTSTTVRRSLQRAQDLSTFAEIRRNILTWKQTGLTSQAVAERLNAGGWLPARRDRFTRAMVDQMLVHERPASQRVRRATAADLEPGEWWMPDLARALGIAETRLRHWRRMGHLRARQIGGRNGRWALLADPAKIDRLRARAQASRPGPR